ncbi:MAG: response regulator [Sedimentisphaerales bacterium]|nr:response regulator [Sedimentisphaerales bacterium]
MSNRIPVLVIEDDEIVQDALKRSLRLNGFEVYQAMDGPSGLKLARTCKPALILLDWMMPEMDGLEVLAELKHTRKTRKIPIFMLTGKGMLSDVDRAFELGADNYIIKPSDLMELGSIVKEKWDKFKSPAGVR